MTEHNSARQKRTAVNQFLFSTQAVAATFSKPTSDDKPTTVVDDAETCPNGDARCDGPDEDELPCFACFEVDR